MTDDKGAAERSAELVADPGAMKAFNEDVIGQFRASAGKIVSGPLAGVPMVVLTITGAKTGRPLVTPLAYTRDGDRLVLIASKGGAPSNPSWYHNLKANPEVRVELGAETFTARATEVTGPERDRLFDAHAAVLPVFKDYAAATSRVIPVFVLERVT